MEERNKMSARRNNELGIEDIKLNLSSVLKEDGTSDLNQKQINIIALASAYSTRNKDVIDSVHAEVRENLAEHEINAAKSAATIMAMNNVYYRFVHLVSDKSFSGMPAKLRMNVIGNPGIDS